MEQTDILEKVDTIKSVLDKSALYRQSLAPVFLFCGVIGSIASLVALMLKIEQATNIMIYWMLIGIFTSMSSVLIMVKQAKGSGDVFWSGPVQRMAHASVPPILVGALGGVYCIVFFPDSTLVSGQAVIGWLALYGLALNSGSIVLASKVRYLGWTFMLCGVIAGFVFELELENPHLQHITMGLGFGVLHLIQGLIEWKRHV